MQLRKLTAKSLMKFGRYKDLTVEEVLRLQPQYIRWAYYNNSHIDFFPEVLLRAKLREDEFISKPGTDPEKGKEIEAKMIRARNSDVKKLAMAKKAASHAKKNKMIQADRMDKRYFGPGGLQKKNHGKRR